MIVSTFPEGPQTRLFNTHLEELNAWNKLKKNINQINLYIVIMIIIYEEQVTSQTYLLPLTFPQKGILYI